MTHHYSKGYRMTVFNLGPGAQVIILQALATYTAIASAYFLARPIIRGQTLDTHRELLSTLRSDNAEVRTLIEKASNVLAVRAQHEHPKTSHDNSYGLAWLIISFILFTGALTLQISTDVAFQREIKNPAQTAREPHRRCEVAGLWVNILPVGAVA
jgi:hypothetical protein